MPLDKLNAALIAAIQNGTPEYTNPAAIKNLMKNYDKDGDYISPATGLAGMDATDIPISQRHVIIDIPEKNRQEMFDNAKREFLEENGIANGDTTKRSEVCKEAGQIKGDVDFRTI